jgi:protein-L-isoaspartate(D-aspartate) O-methyltransferase
MAANFPITISKAVLQAISRIPREEFVPAEAQDFAYSDQPLSIGYGQTISQPSLVALMTDLMGISKKDKVLEIGTGSGYQVAILAQLAKKVYSVEFDPKLAAAAEYRLMKLGFNNITIVVGDGSEGYPQEAPYQKIIVTAAAPTIIPALVNQLKIGGKLLMPVGNRTLQDLVQVTATKTRTRVLNWGKVQFVPLHGRYGWGS